SAAGDLRFAAASWRSGKAARKGHAGRTVRRPRAPARVASARHCTRASGEGRMLLTDKTTFTEFLIEARRNHPEARGDLNGVLPSVATACKAISRAVAHGSLADLLGNAGKGGDINVHGETQKKLDVLANEIFLRLNENRGYVSGMASEEIDDPYL